MEKYNDTCVQLLVVFRAQMVQNWSKNRRNVLVARMCKRKARQTGRTQMFGTLTMCHSLGILANTIAMTNGCEPEE